MAYVKVKREQQTVFVYANPTDQISTIITRLLEMTKAPIAPENIQLVYNGQITDPNQPLSAYTSADGDILQEIRYHDGKWEPVPSN